MSSYVVRNTSPTGTIIKSGLIATALLLNPPNLAVDNLNNEADFLQKQYVRLSASPTFDQHRSFITHEFEQNVDPLVYTMTSVYENLLQEQESLGIEFQKVLNDNLWDLYES